MYNFRTDLALERRNLYNKAYKLEKDIDGIEVESEETNDGKILISRVKVTNNEGAEAIRKPIGNYITIDIKKLKLATQEEIRKIFRNSFKRIT